MIYKAKKTHTHSDSKMSDNMEENFLISPYGYYWSCICMTKKRKFIPLGFSFIKLQDLDHYTISHGNYFMKIILQCCDNQNCQKLGILTSVVDLVQVNLRHRKSGKLTWLFIDKCFQWLMVFWPAMKCLCIDKKQWLLYFIVVDVLPQWQHPDIKCDTTSAQNKAS